MNLSSVDRPNFTICISQDTLADHSAQHNYYPRIIHRFVLEGIWPGKVQISIKYAMSCFELLNSTFVPSHLASTRQADLHVHVGIGLAGTGSYQSMLYFQQGHYQTRYEST